MAKKSIKQLVAYAIKRAKEGHKYKLGGWSWKNGIECHGFVGTVFKDCGYDDVYKRIKKKGFWKKPYGKKYLHKYLIAYNRKGLKAKQLKAGDIIVRPQKIGGFHSAIYVGDGKVAEAVKPRTRVKKMTGKWQYAFRVPEKKPAKKPAKKDKYKVVRKKGANIRKTPSVKADKLGVYKYGTTFDASSTKGLWVKSPKGWVLTKTDKTQILKKV